MKKLRNLFRNPTVSDKFKIPTATKVKFSIGGIGFNLSAGLFAAWLYNFYIKIVQIDPIFWALAWIVYIVWNAINDPLIGYFGDQTRTRFGRRMPWLMIATPLISISFMFLFFPPLMSPANPISQWFFFLWLFIWLLMYDSFYTIIGITQKALVAELTILPEERANTTFFWSIGTLVGQVITFLIPFLFIINKDPYSQNLPTIQTMVVIFGIIGIVLLAVMSFGIKERKEFLFAEKNKMGFLDSIKQTIKNRAFIIYTIFSFTLVYINFAIYSQVSFFVQDVLEISSGNPLSTLPLIVFIGASLVGYPIGMFLNRKFGGKKGIIYLSAFVISGLIFLTFAPEFITSNIALLIVGFSYSGMMLIAPILMADIIDKDELKTGRRREGAYYGTNNLFTKPAQSVAAALTAMVLALTGYNQTTVFQDDLARFGIKLNIGLIPAIFISIGIIVLIKFPIDASTEEYKNWKRRVEELHERKVKEYKRSLEN